MDRPSNNSTSLGVHSPLAHYEQPVGRDPMWFAVYTTPRHEKRLAQYFDIRQIEHFLPLYRALRKWRNGTRASIELPLFPNYIFVRITRHDRVRVLEVPGVLSIAGTGREPVPLSDDEIEALRRWVEFSKIEPHSYLVVGERVRIKAGPLVGVEGILVRKKNSFRVVLTLSLIMASVAVELDAGDIEPAKVRHPIVYPTLGAA